MKDLLIGLAAVMAAAATLGTVLVSPDLTKDQNRFAQQAGIDAPTALTMAQARQRFRRRFFMTLPCAAALILSVWALLVHAPSK
jgi:hypothetical protein